MMLPENIKNTEGVERKVGLEIEYANISLQKTSQFIADIFGGDVVCIHSTVYKVKDSKFGDFKVELDSIPIQEISENNQKIITKKDKNILDDAQLAAGKKLESLSEFFTPFEIVTPPVPVTCLVDMKKLENRLKKEGALGTKSAFQYAFGLHLNPEVPSLKVASLLRHLQSFLLIEPWLKKKHNLDISRKLTSFIDPFPQAYVNLVLNESYNPSMNEFIKNYHQYNPTRNRSLVMLPVMAFVNENYVRELYGKNEKINKRPTFHYRLPNCSIGQRGWSFEDEWLLWLKVEAIAVNDELFEALLSLWNIHNKNTFSLEGSWIEIVSEFIQKNEI